MPQIPLDQKFHTLDADTPTQERGSSLVNAGREIYTMQDIVDTAGGGGGSFKAKSISNYTIASELVWISGFDSTLQVPQVIGSNEYPDRQNGVVCGIVTDAIANTVVDVAVSGVHTLKVITETGTTPVVGTLIYGGAGSQPYVSTETFISSDAFAVGRITNVVSLAASYPGFYDIWNLDVYIQMPVLNASYFDTVSYFDSQRFIASEVGTIGYAEIVKYVSGGAGVEYFLSVERWDSSAGDTPDKIAGVTATGTVQPSSNRVSVCSVGVVEFDLSLIGGSAPVAGGGIYADSTNSYQLTTSSASGVQVGLIQNVTTTSCSISIDVSAGGGGGNTTGEDLSLNVRTNPYSVAGDHEGTVLSIGTATLTVGTVYYWNGTEWTLSNAGAVGTADGLMGIATDSAVAPDVLVSGIIQLSSVPGTVGDPLYLDTADGLLTATAPSGSTEIVRVMGYKLDTNRVYFNPSQDWLEIV